MVFKAGDCAPANSVGNQDLGAGVWLKLSRFYFWTFQDQKAWPSWVTAALTTALLVNTKLLISLSLLTAQHIFFHNSPAHQSMKLYFSFLNRLWGVQVYIFTSRRKTPWRREESQQDHPEQLCCPAGGRQPFSSCKAGQAGQFCRAVSGGPQWSLTVLIQAGDQGLLS